MPLGLGVDINFEQMFPAVDPEAMERNAARAAYMTNKKATTAAIRAFVRAVAKEIKVDTGMAKGSILPLARAIRAASGINISRKRKSHAGYTDMSETYHPAPARRYQGLGEKIGQSAFMIDWGRKNIWKY